MNDATGNPRVLTVASIGMTVFVGFLLFSADYLLGIIYSIGILTANDFRPRSLSDVVLFVLVLSVFIFRHAVMFAELVPRELQWLTEFMLVLLGIVVISRGQWKHLRRPILWLVGGLVLLLGLNVLVWGGSTMVLLNGCRVYLKYIPVYLFFKLDGIAGIQSRMRSLLSMMATIAILQVAPAVFQYFEYQEFGSGDFIVGLMPKHGSGILTVFNFLCIGGIGIAYRLGRLSWPIAISIASLLVVPAVLNETKISLVVAPAIAVFVFFAGRKIFHVRTFLIAGLVSFAVFLGAVSLYNYYWNPDGPSIVSVEYVQSYLFEDYTTAYQGVVVKETASRGGILILSMAMLSEHGAGALVGYGLGSTSDSFLPGGAGQLFLTYGDFVDEFNLFTSILLDLGIIGLAAAAVYVVAEFRKLNRLTLVQPGQDSLLPFLVPVGKLMLVFLAVGSLYFRSVLFDQFALPFWAMLGYVNGQAQNLTTKGIKA